MRAPAGRERGDVAPEKVHGAAVGAGLARDQAEERGLAGAVGPNDEPPLAGLDSEAHVGADAQPAERSGKPADLERDHRAASARPNRRKLQRQRRCEPGTRPSGISTLMATKIAPSTRFQCSI